MFFHFNIALVILFLTSAYFPDVHLTMNVCSNAYDLLHFIFVALVLNGLVTFKH